MASLVHLVMNAAAVEVLHEEANQIEEEMQRLLSEVEQVTVVDAHGVAWERFMELLKRRGEIARKALILFELAWRNVILKDSQDAQREREEIIPQ